MTDTNKQLEKIARIAASWWSETIMEIANTSEDCNKHLIHKRIVGYLPVKINGFNGFKEDLKNKIKEEFEVNKSQYAYIATKDDDMFGILPSIAKKYGFDGKIFPKNITMIITENALFYYKNGNKERLHYLFDAKKENLNQKTYVSKEDLARITRDI